MADQIKTLRMGVDELLYANITGTGVQQPFGFPPQSMNWRGHVVFAAVPVPSSGTVTAVAFSVQLQMQPQGNAISPAGILSQQVLVSAAANTQSAYSGLNLIVGGASTPVIVDLSGLGGTGLLALNITTLTLGTATGVAIYARIG